MENITTQNFQDIKTDLLGLMRELSPADLKNSETQSLIEQLDSSALDLAHTINFGPAYDWLCIQKKCVRLNCSHDPYKEFQSSLSVVDFNNYREDNTRSIELPDGTNETVTMSEDLWEWYDIILSFDEKMTPPKMAEHALEEVKLQNLSFEKGFRCIVSHLAGHWHDMLQGVFDT